MGFHHLGRFLKMHDGLKILLARIMLIAGGFLFFHFGLDWRYGALLVGWAIMTWCILRSYDNWGTVLKRSVLALPFIALVELSLYMLIKPDHYTYWYVAALLFDALILNVPQVLPHYITTLIGTAAAILLIRKQFDAGIGSYTLHDIFLTFFCASYLVILNRDKDKYILVLIKSTVSAMLVVLFFWAFMASDSIIDRYNVPFGYAYGFSCFLGLGFFLVFYNLGKKYFKANNLFKKGNIALPFKCFLNKIL